MKLNSQTYKFTDPGKIGSVALVMGVAGLAATAFGYYTDTDQFFFSYLISFLFWISIALGALFFTLLHHLVDAEWSTVIRRWSESLMAPLSLMALLFLPILFGMHNLFHWSNADVMANDLILQGKAAYLNPTFFVIRSAGYFVIWGVLVTLLNRTSQKQDAGGSKSLTQRLRKISAPGMILFAITISFSSFDWIMSLDAHWFSTIFGLYWYSGSFVAVLCVMILMGLYQRSKSILRTEVTLEHYHDLGKLLFSFIVFWAYMGFSQYLLIWYANIPEETVWFYHRWYNDWQWVSLVLLFGHFALPFLVLITRAAKRNPVVLGATAVWILLMRWFDILWLVGPNLHEHGPHISWMDFTSMIGIGGIFIWFVWRHYVSHPVLPVGDISLSSSMKFENH